MLTATSGASLLANILADKTKIPGGAVITDRERTTRAGDIASFYNRGIATEEPGRGVLPFNF